MNTKSILISLGLIISSFVAGFLVANKLNRSEMSSVLAENEQLKSSLNENSQNEAELSLTTEEIQKSIDEAAAKPDDFDFQKNLGLSLYRYGSMKKDSKTIEQSITLLQRADALRQTDQQVKIGLGNAYFDLGYYNKDNTSLEKARAVYESLLKTKPDDAGIITDLGLTYFLYEPSALDISIAQFQKAYAIDSKNERALQFLIQALLRNGNKVEAAKYLDTLKAVSPQNASIAEFATQLIQNEIPTAK